MRNFNDSTLWPLSDFEQSLRATGTSGYSRLGGPTLLPTNLLNDLGRLASDLSSNDMSDRAQALHAIRRAAARPARKLNMHGVSWAFRSNATGCDSSGFRAARGGSGCVCLVQLRLSCTHGLLDHVQTCRQCGEACIQCLGGHR
jgi:hypothetical protein